MFHWLLFLSASVLIVTLAVMTVITYYFKEKARFRREYADDMGKAIARGLSEIAKLPEIKREENK